MKGLPLRSLIIRIALFVFVIGLWLFATPLVGRLGVAADAEAAAAVRTGLHSLVWIVGAFVAIAAINVFFWDGVVQQLVRRPVPTLLKTAFACIVLIVAAMGIVGIVFNRDVTAIWATSGAFGIVLGLALRNMIQDVFTGIAINLDGSIKAGDWVELHAQDFAAEKYGRVVEVNWRTSRIRLDNDTVVVVPNSRMGMMAVTNYAHFDHTSRLEVEVVLDFAVSTARAVEVLTAAAKAAVAHPGIRAHPEPHAIVSRIGERGVHYLVRFWGRVVERTPQVMRNSVMREVMEHLRFAGITPAFPKEDIFHATMPNRALSHDAPADRARILSCLDILSGAMTREEIESLAASIAPATFKRGETLVRQGDSGTSMYIVAEGLLDVHVAGETKVDPIRVGHIRAGELFGEMSLLTGEPRSATVVAACDVVVYQIDQARFGELLSARPAIAEAVSAIVADRRLRTDEALRSASTETIEAERSRLKSQILERMKSVFVYIVDNGRRRRLKGTPQ